MDATRAINGVGLYESGSLDLKFSSAEKLPENLKEKANKVFRGVQPSQVRDNVPGPVRSLIQALGQHGNGDFMVAGGADNVMVSFKIHAPGLSNFFTN